MNRTLYCPECKQDVPVEELEDSSVVIHCPKCIGECAACDCHLAANCFDPETRVLLRPARAQGEE